MSKEKLIKHLLREFMEPYDEKLASYILDNQDRYFDDEFLDDLKDKVGWIIIEEINRADSDAEYAWKHLNDTVTLDKTRGEMHFNDFVTPAYWYRSMMSEEEINRRLSFFKTVWAGADYRKDLKYPILMSWHDMSEWEAVFGKDYPFNRMERDLECCDTEEARELYSAYEMNLSAARVEDIYPYQIKKITRIENLQISEDGDSTADITIKLLHGGECSIHVTMSKYGRITGMRALDRTGFPMMSERDNRMIVEQVFGKEYDRHNRYWG